MASEKINYSFFFFLMNWPQICNENIFCKDNRMDQDIFNQFLITEPSDSKPLVPDSVPAPRTPALLPDGTGKISMSFHIPNTGLWMLLAKTSGKEACGIGGSGQASTLRGAALQGYWHTNAGCSPFRRYLIIFYQSLAFKRLKAFLSFRV